MTTNQSESVSILAQPDLYNIVYLFDVITSDSAKITVREIHLAESLGYEQALVYISSPGGNVDDGLAILDAIENSGMDITVVGTGCVASMAALIIINSPVDHRFITPRATMYLHESSFSPFEDTIDKMKKNLQEHQVILDQLMQITSKRCRKTKKRFEEDIKKTMLMTAQQSLRYNAIDEIWTEKRMTKWMKQNVQSTQ